MENVSDQDELKRLVDDDMEEVTLNNVSSTAGS